MARNPEHYAIVIGINGYKQIRPLNAAVADATRFAEWLIKEEGGGLPPENVKLIVSPPVSPANPFDARPVQQEVDAALVEMGIKTRERIGQRLYFYFAGHGVGPSFDDIAMLMATAAMDQLNYNIGLRPYRLFFHDRKSFDEIVYLIDCCRDPVQGFRLGEPSFNLAKSQAVDKKVQDFVVMAAEYGEKAFEPRDPTTGERRSILTKALLEGLEDLKAADPLGRITANSLCRYVEESVPKLTTDPKLRQIPKVDLNNLRDDIVIYTVPNTTLPRVKVHIHTTVAEAGGRLNLFDNNLRPVLSQPTAQARIDSPWEVFLVKGKWYILNYSESPNGLPKIIDLTNAADDVATIIYE